MKYLDCSIICLASYNGRILLPEHIQTFEEAIDYAKSQLKEIPLGEMEYITDSDMLDEKNCRLYVEDTMENACGLN